MPFSKRRQEGSPPPKKRPARKLRLVGALLLVPPAIWAILLVAVPTSWARDRIVAALSDATGRSVKLSAVRLGVLGGVRLEGLEIGQPEAPESPWLKADRISLDLGLLQLASGHCLPNEIRGEGVYLRIHRRADGSLEIGDLCHRSASRTKQPAEESESESEPAEVAFRLSGSRIEIIDDRTATNLELEGVEGQGTWQPHILSVSDLKGRMNGGPFDLSATLERDKEGASFEGRLRADDVALSEGMKALGYLVPVVSESKGSVDGRLALDVYLKGREAPGVSLWRGLTGQGRLTLDPIELEGSPFVADLARVARLSSRDRTGSVRSDFEIGNGRIVSKNLTLKFARIPIVLVGWTGFDGTLDYRVKSDEVTEKLARTAKGLLDDLPIDLNELASVRVRGTLDHLVWTVGDLPLDGGPDSEGRSFEDKFRQLGRHLKDKIRR